MVWILLPLPTIFFRKKALPIFSLGGRLASSFYTDAPETELEALIRVSGELGVEVSLSEIRPRVHMIVWHRVTVAKLDTSQDKERFEFALRALVSMLVVKGYTISPAVKRHRA